MATPSHAQAVKSLNKSPGRRRFVFQTFSQRVQEIDIDVYRSLDKVKSEPSEGSSYLRDCLMEWRELNTAEDFIFCYETILPLVQTLPLVILHKESIFSTLVSRVQIKGRLSLEPILRSIAALSRDLLEDFLPFLPRITDALVSLLEGGAEREPEIIEQMFTSWSYIMMYLQKYFTRNLLHLLKVTTTLRYYSKDYIQEFMAEATSILLRNAPVDQLKNGIKQIIKEVVKKQSTRIYGASALLFHTMRGTSSMFHSRAELVLRFLISCPIFDIGRDICQGSDSILEVVESMFHRLCEELNPEELNMIWKCLFEEIMNAVTNGYVVHLTDLVMLLASAVPYANWKTVSDYEPMLKLVDLLVGKFVIPLSVSVEDDSFEVINMILKLMLVILDGVQSAGDSSFISSCSLHWAPIFRLKRSSLLTFIREVLQKDASVLCAFRTNILSTMNELIETSPEEVIYLLLSFCERLPTEVQCTPEEVSRIYSFFLKIIGHWIKEITDIAQGSLSSTDVNECELAIFWGVIRCFPYILKFQAKSSLLVDLIDALDQLSTIEGNTFGIPKGTVESLIGATLNSYLKLLSGEKSGIEESRNFLYLAKRYNSCSQVLLAVADYLDFMYGPALEAATSRKKYSEDLRAEKVEDAVKVFADNLRHSNKEIRISTLRILCHYEPLGGDILTKDLSIDNEMEIGNSHACDDDGLGSQVLRLFLSIESTSISISTSRKIISLISRVQMALLAGKIPEAYLSIVLNGMIGIFHKRFSHIWDQASECLASLIRRHTTFVWDQLLCYFQQWLFLFDQPDREIEESSDELNDLLRCFHSFVVPASDCTPLFTVLSLVLQSLQKIPSAVESQSRNILPLFLTFLGYNSDHVAGVDSFKPHSRKSKEWKCVLKEWLNLLRRTQNLKSFYKSEFLKEVLERRLLDDNDAEIQSKVLDCLLIWKDDYLTLYDQHLKNLICPKTLREELTRWSLSRESNQIEEQHRPYLVPLVTRVLMPKVRKLKILGSRKQACVNLRKAVLIFIAQLEASELPLFFDLLLKPLNVISREPDATANWFWNSHTASLNRLSTVNFMKFFSSESITALSWKKRYGFLHVIEEVLAVFDEMHVMPFLNILLGSLVRVLENCTSSLHAARRHEVSLVENDDKSNKRPLECDNEAAISGLTSTTVKQYKELRSLCLKVISVVLNKYKDYDFGSEFWDLFFKSVKSSIESFKQEGASSEKPSSLFSCFIAMGRSQKLVPLLAREKNLVPDIFSILTVSSASQSIISCVLQFIENLLTFDGESDGQDSALRSVILPNLDALIFNLHGLFLGGGASKRKLIKHPEERMIRILKLVSKLIRDRLHAKKFVEILLPYLTHSVRISDLQVDTLQVIQNVVPILGSGCTTEILKAVSPLLTSVELGMRFLICDLIDGLAAVDSSILDVAQIIRGLNATSAMEIDGLDFDTVVNTYEKINADFFCAIPVEHALVVLSQCVHDMTSEDLILRHSAYRSFLSFVEFSSSILGQEEMVHHETLSDNTYWSKVCILRITNKFILKHMGEAMNRASSVKKEWINLLREMVLKFPDVANFSSLKALYSNDAEVDFFSNITHLQRSKRAKALSRFKNTISTLHMPEVVTKNVFVPLFFNMLFDLQEGKDESIRIACMEALSSICGRMEWKSYFALLKRCFREITKNMVKRKVLVRLICSILDNFHFLENISNAGLTDPDYPIKSHAYGTSVVTNEIQECLIKVVLPKIQKLMNYQSEKVDVYVNLAALKVLKLLPEDVMDSQLLSIIHHIVNFLKNRLESVREEARSALAACLKELGLEYLQVIVRVLRGTLKRGYELHVLGYTLNFILSKFIVGPICGKMDYCLEDLLSVVEKDILGEVAEEKEVEKLASKMKETRKQKSFETLKLIAQSIIFKTHALKLLKPVTDHMKNHLTPKIKAKLENMLTNIAAGFESNPSVDQSDLLIFIYGLIEDGIKGESAQGKSSSIVEAKKHTGDVRGKNLSCGTILAKSPASHLIMVFALKLLNGYMKKVQLASGNGQLLSMLDPFVALLGNCLTSKYEDVLSISLRCLTPLLRFPLPSIKSQADKIKGVVLNIAQSSTDPHSPLIESCLRILTVLLRNEKVTLSTHQLHLLIQFPLFVDIDKNPSFVALSLLKAIIGRKLVAPEIYDLATRVAELMVTSQVEPIRKKCSKILLQFLLDYRLSEKRLQQHLDFLLSNLRYEHSTGREAVLEMLYAIIVKFPQSVVDSLSQTLFIHLVVCLANDKENNVRSMSGAVIKRLIGCISSGPLHSVLDYSLSWYLGGKQQLWSAAAQVLGLLVEALKRGFERHVKTVLPVARGILRSVVDVTMNEELDFSAESSITIWKEAYYSLVMLEKIFHQFHELFFDKDFKDTWEMICHLLLHPHMWIRSISNRLLALYFTTQIVNSRQNSERSFQDYSLMKPSRLFLVAVSLCCQLKSQLTDNDGDVILQNIVFAICGLHSVIGRVENANSCVFWSTLEQPEQKHFLKALQLLDSGKGRSVFLRSITGVIDQNDGCAEEIQYLLVSNLLKQMGKIALQTDIIQMKIVFSAFSDISSQISVEDFQRYAYDILLPLYRVREGFAGKLIPESMNQLAHEVSDRIQNRLGIQNFVQVYSQIKKHLKAKRDKRKQEEKRMAVVNPMRNAKRKLRVAAKQRASKKRKIMTLKMSRRML